MLKSWRHLYINTLFVSCSSISRLGALQLADCRPTVWAVSCPLRSSHVVRCQGATRHGTSLLCRPSVPPISISLSPSLLTPQTARGTAQRFLNKPDPGCAWHCGRKTTWALYFNSSNEYLIPLLDTVAGHDLMRKWHVGFIADSPAGWYLCSVLSVIDSLKLPFWHALHNAMHFLWLCVSPSPLSCQSEGWPLPSGPSPTSPCNSWPCWCLPDLKALTVDNLSENSLPDKSSQFSDIPNMLDWNPTQSENVYRQTNKPETKSVSASESKTVFHWESGSFLGTILANASVPMIPQCCYGKLPSASPHLWRTAAVYPQLPTALPTALPG